MSSSLLPRTVTAFRYLANPMENASRSLASQIIKQFNIFLRSYLRSFSCILLLFAGCVSALTETCRHSCRLAWRRWASIRSVAAEITLPLLLFTAIELSLEGMMKGEL